MDRAYGMRRVRETRVQSGRAPAATACGMPAAWIGSSDARTTGWKDRYGMDLTIWLPAMFLLGLVAMIGCYAFIGACEKI